MIEAGLGILHYALLLLYGIVLSAAFAGVEPTKRNAVILGALFAACGLAQLAALLAFGEEFVWMAYPLLGHAPIAALLCLRYRKRPLVALAAVATAYLCCQPAKWIGVLVEALVGNPSVVTVARILTLLAVGYLALRYASDCIASIYNRDSRSALVFGIVPFVYYLFDYAMAVYTDLWTTYAAAAIEFVPAFLCATFLSFSVAYYRIFEQKMEVERREQVIGIALEQQARELEAVRQGEHKVRLLRHDMKLHLENIACCLEGGDVEAAQRLLADYAESVESTAVRRFCDNSIVNYMISNCQTRCEREQVSFEAAVDMKNLPVDELAFASILSNALDNAINAQDALPAKKRQVKMSLKVQNGRLLLSVRNACVRAPRFVDGVPVTTCSGHGYGTQSIRYMVEHLGGSCQFSMEGEQFVLRVVINL